MGWVVRANIDQTSMKRLPRSGQLWVHASTLILRIGLFAGGCLVWVEALQSHPTIASVALTITNIGLVTFILCSFPLLPQDGYHWLAEYLEQPRLRGRAFTYLRMWFVGRRPPEQLGPGERGALMFYATGTLICTAIWAGGISLQMYIAAVNAYSGLGMLWVLTTFIMGLVYFLLLAQYITRMKAQHRLQLAQRGAG
jgi:hypothetical protein